MLLEAATQRSSHKQEHYRGIFQLFFFFFSPNMTLYIKFDEIPGLNWFPLRSSLYLRSDKANSRLNPKNWDQIRRNSGSSVFRASNDCLFCSAWERSGPSSSPRVDSLMFRMKPSSSLNEQPSRRVFPLRRFRPRYISCSWWRGPADVKNPAQGLVSFGFLPISLLN